MGLVFSLIGGASAKIYIFAAAAMGAMLVLVGCYRAGMKSAVAAENRKALEQVRKNQLIKESVDEEILRVDNSGGDARERMRSEWYRD